MESKYPQIWPDIESWPIYKMHQSRSAFVDELIEFALSQFEAHNTKKTTEIIAKTIYRERIRLEEEPWKVDPADEKLFWRKIRKEFMETSLDQPEEVADIANEKILRKIITRYAEEIVATFNKKTFLFARKFLITFFTRLLNTAASRNYRRIWNREFKLSDRLKIKGNIEEVRSLMQKGTVMMVPTHFSNLDSILVGFCLDIIGLPAFIYGAGLNLFNSGAVAFFMNRLGAYRVDRRKKNTVYLETLKSMSNLALQKGVNSLFFPGGTRSRSGALESSLKMGLLGTAVDAQGILYKEKKDEKVFVIPVIMSYPFVLEAKHLIEQDLQRRGREQYMVSKDASLSIWQTIRFVWKIFSQSNAITLSIGQPMDVMGNRVDSDGVSYDKFGNVIDVKDYFMLGGEVTHDSQRNNEYTKSLSKAIVERYKKDNIVLSSHLVAFAAFQVLLKKHKKIGLYGTLRLPVSDFVFDKQPFYEVVEILRTQLKEMESNGDVKLSDTISLPAEELVKHGITHLGTFHAKDPLLFAKKTGEIVSQDFKTLYYYHNRLTGYDLEAFVPENIEVVVEL